MEALRRIQQAKARVDQVRADQVRTRLEAKDVSGLIALHQREPFPLTEEVLKVFFGVGTVKDLQYAQKAVKEFPESAMEVAFRLKRLEVARAFYSSEAGGRLAARYNLVELARDHYHRDFESVAVEAIKCGHLAFLQALCATTARESLKYSYPNRSYAAELQRLYLVAAEHGQLEILTAVNQLLPHSYAVTYDHREAFARALAGGHHETARFLRPRFTLTDRDYADLVRRLGDRLNVEALELLDIPPQKVVDCQVGPVAAQSGRLDVLQWLATKYKLPPYQWTRALNTAVGGGQRVVVEWMVENDLARPDSTTVEAAISGGQLALLQFIAEHRPVAATPETLDRAIKQQPELARYLITRTATEASTQAVERAIEANRPDLVRALYEHGKTCPLESIVLAATRGCLELVEYLHDAVMVSMAPRDRDSLLQRALREAVKADRVEVVIWLAGHGVPCRDSTLLQRAIERNDLATARRLLEAKVSGSVVIDNIVFERDQLPMLKLLLEHGALGGKECIKQAAQRGDPAVVELLLQHGQAVSSESVVVAGLAGHLEVMGQLAERCPPDQLRVALVKLIGQSGSSEARASDEAVHQLTPLVKGSLAHAVRAARLNNRPELAQWLAEQPQSP